MRTSLVFLALLAFAKTPAQTDSVTTNRNVLMVGVDGNGGYVDVQAQDTTRKPEPMVINTKHKKITISFENKPWFSETDSVREVLHELRTERRNKFTYWSGIDLGLNMLLGPDGGTDLPQKADFMELDQLNSRFFAINFMEQKIEFGSHHVGLLTGLGWEFNNYRLKRNDLLQFSPDSVYATPVEAPQFRKNKLRQSGLRMPLMLEFNTQRAKLPTEAEVLAAARDTIGGRKPPSFGFNTKKNFHIAVGVVGTWYYDSMYKQKYVAEGVVQKDVDKGEHQLLPYRLAASTRIGYGSLNLFAEYALTPLFKENLAPELTPLTVGLTIIGFN